MALVLKDRVKGWTDSYGEDNFVIFATTNGYQSFSVIGNGNQTYYTVFDPTNYDWEVGIGTYTAATTTLSRDTILSSSNNNLIVSFLPGTKELFVGYPAEKAVTLDTPQTITDKTLVNATVTSGTINNTTIGATTPASGAFTTLVASGASLTSVNAGVALLTSATVTTLNATSVSIASANVGNLQGTAASIGSINAGVAVVTNLIATGASVASINAGVALFTNATTTTLNATGASIASANIGNLQFTAASIASINAGIAVITNLTATSASIASMNAGVALLTTATATTLNATGASIASANIGNLQFTAASIASINAGVAVITNLTATGASIASANVGTAVITALTVTGASVASANFGNVVTTTERVTNLSVTNASVASINAAVALVTTGTVTNLTSTGASIASANLGTAVITGLTATGASIASANIGNASITTLSFTNASITSANIGTAVITTLTATGASIASVNAGVAVLAAGTAALPSLTTTGDTNTGVFFPAADTVGVTTGGSERLRVDSSGNVGIGTASFSQKLAINSANTSTNSLVEYKQGDVTQAYVGMGSDNILRIESLARPTGVVAGGANYAFVTTNGSERMRIDSSGNVGIGGTAGAASKLNVLGTYSAAGNNAFAVTANGAIPSGATTNGISFLSVPTTAAASFTCSQLSHFYASQGAFGAGSAVTNQFGFYVESTLTGATNNFGFYSNIASGSNRWNFYANGTAQNYFAGRVGVGTTTLNVGFEVASTATEDNRSLRVAYDTTYYYEIRNLGSAGNRLRSNNGEMLFNITGTDYARLTTAGEFITGGTTDQGAYNLQCNGTGVWGAGAYVNGSDARLKDNIQSLDSGLDVVKAMRPVTFQYKPDYSKDQSVQPGFIAQELQTAMAGKPYLEGVVQEGTNHLNVAYQNIIPILVKAIQELEAKVAALEAK